MSETAAKFSKLKLNRRLLVWALPATLIPTVLFLLVTKGSDLGQNEADAKAAAQRQEQREQAMSQRVQNPAAEAEEAARKASEARSALPPPPSAGGIEQKSAQARLGELRDARDIIGPTLNDAERQSTGMGDAAPQQKKSYVVYTAPAKEGMVSSAAGAVLLETKPEIKDESTPKPFLSANNDKVTSGEVTTARRIDGLYWIAPGTIIRAVLLNAVDTSIPGQVTARTTEPVYDSRYGRHLVVPVGSTLIGQYDSSIANGQRRVMMAFSSLVTPSGGVVDLGGTRVSDALGRLGVEGELHTHFWRRMGTAALFAIEAVGMDRLANSQTTVSASGSTSTTTNTSEAARIISEAAKQEPWLKPVKPNITIEEGQKISIVTMASIEVPPVANKR